MKQVAELVNINTGMTIAIFDCKYLTEEQKKEILQLYPGYIIRINDLIHRPEYFIQGSSMGKKLRELLNK